MYPYHRSVAASYVPERCGAGSGVRAAGVSPALKRRRLGGLASPQLAMFVQPI